VIFVGCDQVWIAGHNLYACDALVLYARCQNHDIAFETLVQDANITCWIDTLALANSQPELASAQSKRLEELVQFALKRTMDAHDAHSDAVATLDLLRGAPGFLKQLSSNTVRIGRTSDHFMPYIKRQHSAKGEKKAGGDEREEGEHDPAEYPESSDEEDPEEDKRWTEINVATLPVHDDAKEDWRPDIKSTQLKTGPRGIDMDESKRGIFLKLMRQGTIEQIVAQTNNYAQQHNRSNWTPTTVDEMWAFIGCVLLIGTKHMERQEVWLEWPFGDDFIKRVFYERRFVDLLACFHMVDNETTTAATKKEDSFWQVRPLIDSLNQSFEEFYVPEQHISVDEITTPCRGRHRAKMYNKSKPVKWGFKTFACAESKTGYVIKFFPYQGKDQKRPPGMGLGEWAVAEVLPTDFNNKGYIVSADNYFMSRKTLELLVKRGFHGVGTTRAGRKGQPSVQMLACSKNAPRGTTRVFQRGDSPLYAVAWKDRKDVRMLSSFPTAIGTCERSIKRTRENEFRKETISRPTIVGYYNGHMHGVDLNDQITSYFRPTIRSMRPTRNYLFHLMQLAGTAAAVLHRHTRNDGAPALPVKHDSTKGFVRYLSLELIQPFLDGRSRSEKKRRESYEHSKTVVARPRLPGSSACVPKSMKKRRKCVVCQGTYNKRKDVSTMCVGCNVYLCIDEESTESSDQCDAEKKSNVRNIKCWTEFQTRP
jgi:hypothetical protein